MTATLLAATPAEVARFMRYVDKLPSGCWFWTGARSRGKGNRKWYGSFRLGHCTVRAHRFSLCVNPQHLEVVTRAVNQDRKVQRRGDSV